jgi:pilus assembly protein Flp/PilA
MAQLRSIMRRAYGRLSARVALPGERGATAVEYGLMVALIAVVIIASVIFLGAQTRDSFDCSAEMVRQRGAVC